MNLPNNGPPIGLGHFTFLDLSPIDLTTLAARTGFSAVGLRLHPVEPGAHFYDIRPGTSSMLELKSCLRDEGIVVYDVESIVIEEELEPNSLKPVLEAAGELGASTLTVCADDPDLGRLVEKFAKVCDLSDEAGITVDLECMSWREINSLDKAIQVVSEAGSKNAKILIDALHFIRCGDQPEDLSRLPPTLIRSAQLCDAPLPTPIGTEALINEARSRRYPPGLGQLPLKEIIAQLPSEVCYSVEVPMQRTEEPLVQAQIIFDATVNLFKKMIN